MIEAKKFQLKLKELGIKKSFGIPDSTMKEFIHALENPTINANEGSSIAAACGHHLATKEIPLVFLQNSGLGNAVNPLASLALVYNIPMLLMIGWRGEGNNDEPQHEVMGAATAKILEALGIDCDVLSISQEKAELQILNALEKMQTKNKPFAFLVRQKTFKGESAQKTKNDLPLRADILKELLLSVDSSAKFFATTGYTGRELYTLAKEQGKLNQIFLGTGSMGHISQVALNYAKHMPDKTIYCLDGDGSLAMHLGNTLDLFKDRPKNLKYIVFNNHAHLSVNHLETVWANQSITKLLNSFGVAPAENLTSLHNDKKFSFIELECNLDTLKDLPRPEESHFELKKLFEE
ncbi:MAG: thiamine pyrophosphate-binding protein [Bdellovibrionota bacterium]|nr:thiamine pyrophosphate-binding protein [Bdellovibrionota bacterium]